MANIRVKFYVRNSSEPIYFDVPNDVVEIQLPEVTDESEFQRPALNIHVNTDNILVYTVEGMKVASYDFRDDLIEALEEIVSEVGGYLYETAEDCREAGDHLTSVDANGCCNACGEQCGIDDDCDE